MQCIRFITNLSDIYLLQVESLLYFSPCTLCGKHFGFEGDLACSTAMFRTAAARGLAEQFLLFLLNHKLSPICLWDIEAQLNSTASYEVGTWKQVLEPAVRLRARQNGELAGYKGEVQKLNLFNSIK